MTVPINPKLARTATGKLDARALPLRDGSVDVLFSNLCLQWVEDLPAVFAGFRRVLKPGGLMLVSTFGPSTLWELREAFAEADDAPHVSLFPAIAQFGDALIAAGFKDPVLDRDEFGIGHPDLGHLMRELRTIGATNAMATRRRSLTGRARFARAAEAYEPMRRDDGQLAPVRPGEARDASTPGVGEAMAAVKDPSGPTFRERIAANSDVQDTITIEQLDSIFDPWDQLGNVDATFERLGLGSGIGAAS